MSKKNKVTDFQAINDLVAVHVLTQVAWQAEKENSPSEIAEHQSDEESMEILGGHASDSEEEEQVSLGFAWRLAKVLRRFFAGR